MWLKAEPHEIVKRNTQNLERKHLTKRTTIPTEWEKIKSAKLVGFKIQGDESVKALNTDVNAFAKP